MDHSELETLVDKEGREVLRQLCQDHLDLRASQEQKLESVKGGHGVQRSHRRGGETIKLRLTLGDVGAPNELLRPGDERHASP